MDALILELQSFEFEVKSKEEELKSSKVVFDMDVPVIDFSLIKRMVLGDDHADIKSRNTSRIDILHQIEQWRPNRQQKAYTIITDFECQVHERLQIMSIKELCEFLDSRQIRRGLITRNIKESVDLFHLQFAMKEFSSSLSRDFCCYKPHPPLLLTYEYCRDEEGEVSTTVQSNDRRW